MQDLLKTRAEAKAREHRLSLVFGGLSIVAIVVFVVILSQFLAGLAAQIP